MGHGGALHSNGKEALKGWIQAMIGGNALSQRFSLFELVVPTFGEKTPKGKAFVGFYKAQGFKSGKRTFLGAFQ